jgi:hypothetical protein
VEKRYCRCSRQVDIMAINEQLGSFSRRFFVDAMEFNATLNVAIRPKD